VLSTGNSAVFPPERGLCACWQHGSGLDAKISRRVPTFTERSEPLSMNRKTAALSSRKFRNCVCDAGQLDDALFARTARFRKHRGPPRGSLSLLRPRPRLGDEAGPYAGSQITHNGAARSCVQQAVQFSSGLLSFASFGKQRQQHRVPIFVTLRIALALGYQPSIMLNVCVVYETVHRDFPLAVSKFGPPPADGSPTMYCSRRMATKN
jgi:hypothetical protein